MTGAETDLIHPDFLLSSPARERLAAWQAAGSPAAHVEEVALVAGPEEAALIRTVLGELPKPILWHVSRHVAIVALGRGANGWTLLQPTIHAEALERPRVVVATWTPGPSADREFRGIVAHELGHVWAGPRRPLAEAAARPTTAELGAADHDAHTVRVLATTWGLVDTLADDAADEEWFACRFAGRLGYRDTGAGDELLNQTRARARTAHACAEAAAR